MSEKIQSRWADSSPEDRIYYTRLVFAILAASICLGFNLSGVLGIFGFLVGILLIVLSYFLAVLLLGVDPEAIGGHLRGLTQGLGTAILLFLLVWFLIYNFLIVVSL